MAGERKSPEWMVWETGMDDGYTSLMKTPEEAAKEWLESCETIPEFIIVCAVDGSSCHRFETRFTQSTIQGAEARALLEEKQ